MDIEKIRTLLKEIETQEEIDYLFTVSASKTLASHLGIEFLEFQKGLVRAQMDVDERTQQAFGYLHGGASIALAETLCSVGALLVLSPDERKEKNVFGVEINGNHLQSVRAPSQVIAVAECIHQGKKIQVWSCDIFDSQKRKVCIVRMTLAVVERRQYKA